MYKWRERSNYSQSEAALRLNVSTRTLQEWEQGRATPAHLALSAIERIIGRV
jgi:DNA-binding transcriptional regulator YiaG